MPESTAACTVAEYLAIRLREIGVKHIFTVPGDYCAPFLNVIDQLPGIERVPNINELGSGYAADGYARFRGVAAACVQYGVGSLSLLNALAGSYVEFVPVAIVSSSPNAADRLLEAKQNILFHHSTGDLRADQLVFENVTVASVVITSSCGAPEAIDQALTEMLTARRPVYIEVINSAWTLRCTAPNGELKARHCASDPASLTQAVAAAQAAMAKAQRPVFFFGIELQRFGLQKFAQGLVDATGIRFTTTSLAKTVLDEAQPLFAGTYAGPASVPYTNDLVTSSDCVIALGTIITDDYLALMSSSFSTMIRVSQGETRVGVTYFPSVTLADFMAALLQAVEAQPPAKRDAPEVTVPQAADLAEDDAVITFERFFEAVGAFVVQKQVRDEYILILGESTSLYVFGNLFGLPAESFVAQAAWGSLGHETGSALGVALATGKRPLVVAGDGGFMMICQEISSLVRANANAAVFVMSNHGYAIEQAFVDLNAFKPGGKFAPFDDLPTWDYGAGEGVRSARDAGRAHGGTAAFTAETTGVGRADAGRSGSADARLSTAVSTPRGRAPSNAEVPEDGAHEIAAGLGYSYRNATTGSTLVARSAGIRHATNATHPRSAATTDSVTGSYGLTPNKRVDITRAASSEPINPSTNPAAANAIPLVSTSRSKFPVLAPSAARMPISCVRCTTAYAITP
jgi:indolepyruvate decarboxylase